MRRLRRYVPYALCCLLALLFAIAALMPLCAANAEQRASLTLLFTTDIHSNSVPHLAMHNDSGVRLGGFARLKTAVDTHWIEGETLLLDSGDFSMGTLYQNYTQSDALELTLMDQIGYDAVALGNHDFELGEAGLHSELTTFRSQGGKLTLLSSNLTSGSGQVTSERDNNPLIDVGVQNYTVFERNGLRVGVFSLMGPDAISYTPVTTFSFSDPVESAKAIVTKLREIEKVDLVVALSHAGTMPDGSFHEDADIAAAVNGIDVILSGHEHVPMQEMQVVNGTMIVCAGTALNYLGKLTLTNSANGWAGDCALVPLDDTFAEDAEIAASLARYTDRIDAEYLAPMGVAQSAMEEFAVSDYDFPDGDHMCLALQNYPFGALIADAYFDGLHHAGITDVAAVAIPVGFVRNGLYRGELQVMDVYNALSYGISPLDGSSGAPICVFYLNGRELYDLCETSVSLSPMMNTVQMLLGGLRFDYSNGRLPLSRVFNVEVRNPATGVYESVMRNESTLYKVAVSYTALQNIALLGQKSYNLLDIAPKDADGVAYPADQLLQTIVRRTNGSELKEWYALYGYIGSMAQDAGGLHAIDARYGKTPVYMTEHAGSIGLFFQNPSKTFRVAAGAVVLLLSILVLLVILIKKLVVCLCKRNRV